MAPRSLSRGVRREARSGEATGVVLVQQIDSVQPADSVVPAMVRVLHARGAREGHETETKAVESTTMNDRRSSTVVAGLVRRVRG